MPNLKYKVSEFPAPNPILKLLINESELLKLIHLIGQNQKFHVKHINIFYGLPHITLAIFYKFRRKIKLTFDPTDPETDFEKIFKLSFSKSIGILGFYQMNTITVFPDIIFISILLNTIYSQKDKKTVNPNNFFSEVHNQIAHTFAEEIAHGFQNLTAKKYLLTSSHSRQILYFEVGFVVLLAAGILYYLNLFPPIIFTFFIISTLIINILMIPKIISQTLNLTDKDADNYANDPIENDAKNLINNLEILNQAKKAFTIDFPQRAQFDLWLPALIKFLKSSIETN